MKEVLRYASITGRNAVQVKIDKSYKFFPRLPYILIIITRPRKLPPKDRVYAQQYTGPNKKIALIYFRCYIIINIHNHKNPVQ